MQFLRRLLHAEGTPPASLPARASWSSWWWWQQWSPWWEQHVASLVCQLRAEWHRHDVPEYAACCHSRRNCNGRRSRSRRRRSCSCRWRRGNSGNGNGNGNGNSCCCCWRSWGNAAGHFAKAARCGQVAHVQLSPQLGSAYDALQALRVSGTCSTWHVAGSRVASCKWPAHLSRFELACAFVAQLLLLHALFSLCFSLLSVCVARCGKLKVGRRHFCGLNEAFNFQL